jgi:hypothetical protein
MGVSHRLLAGGGESRRALRASNDPEVTMTDAPTNSNLTAYRKAIEAAGIAIDLVRRVPSPLKSLADQVIRSAASVAANLAEGHGRHGRDRAHHDRVGARHPRKCFISAFRSGFGGAWHRLWPSGTLVPVSLTGAVDRGKAMTALQLFDEVRAMTWRLLNPIA